MPPCGNWRMPPSPCGTARCPPRCLFEWVWFPAHWPAPLPRPLPTISTKMNESGSVWWRVLRKNCWIWCGRKSWIWPLWIPPVVTAACISENCVSGTSLRRCRRGIPWQRSLFWCRSSWHPCPRWHSTTIGNKASANGPAVQRRRNPFYAPSTPPTQLWRWWQPGWASAF